jgi:hypothetical protein
MILQRLYDLQVVGSFDSKCLVLRLKSLVLFLKFETDSHNGLDVLF